MIEPDRPGPVSPFTHGQLAQQACGISDILHWVEHHLKIVIESFSVELDIDLCASDIHEPMLSDGCSRDVKRFQARYRVQ